MMIPKILTNRMPKTEVTQDPCFIPPVTSLGSFPSKIVWLSGAPGAGKGTNEKQIIDGAGLYPEPLVASALLNTPEMLEKVNRGLLLDDPTVVSAVFEALQNSIYRQGVLVDGFPRTLGQAESVAWLYDQLCEYGHSPLFAVFVLMIDKSESLRRQQHRAQEALAHNSQVQKSGKGQMEEVRPTDLDPKIASRRYEQFMDLTYTGLVSLKDRLPFYQIDSKGTREEVRQRIARALKEGFGHPQRNSGKSYPLPE
ncbi:MAG: nucleoside monophosphate kinase [Puniceicoccales bacterium]|jgi:adenylate kinase|nr:nucleoside monophosphate kinase [Puniceicoccales bacterium]